MKKNKTIWTILQFAIGISAGVLLSKTMFPLIDQLSDEMIVIFPLIIFAAVLVAIVLHVILHELGHLVAGAVSGYKFLFFRIFSLMIVKTDGKLRLRRLGVAGTAGQCIMLPPEEDYESAPYLLPALGGVISNLFFSVIFLVLYCVLPAGPVLSTVLLCGGVMGVFTALTNGIPIDTGLVVNDGYNARVMRKSKSARRAYFVQHEMVLYLLDGKNPTEMPDEWFSLPKADDMDNALSAFFAVAHVDRLMAEKRFDEAIGATDFILENAHGMCGVHRAMLICNLMYCEMIAGTSRDRVEKLRTKEQVAVMKQMKNFPAVIRTEYAYTMLCEDDRAGSVEMLKRFDKIAKSYPYSGDIEGERELMLLADKKYYEIKGATNGKS